MAIRQRTRIEQRKAIILALVLVGLSFGYSVSLGQHGVRRYLDLRTALTERSHDAYERIVRNREMADQIERLRTDDRFLESVARSRLGVASPDEVVLVFGDDDEALRHAEGEPGAETHRR